MEFVCTHLDLCPFQHFLNIVYSIVTTFNQPTMSTGTPNRNPNRQRRRGRSGGSTAATSTRGSRKEPSASSRLGASSHRSQQRSPTSQHPATSNDETAVAEELKEQHADARNDSESHDKEDAVSDGDDDSSSSNEESSASKEEQASPSTPQEDVGDQGSDNGTDDDDNEEQREHRDRSPSLASSVAEDEAFNDDFVQSRMRALQKAYKDHVLAGGDPAYGASVLAELRQLQDMTREVQPQRSSLPTNAHSDHASAEFTRQFTLNTRATLLGKACSAAAFRFRCEINKTPRVEVERQLDTLERCISQQGGYDQANLPADFTQVPREVKGDDAIFIQCLAQARKDSTDWPSFRSALVDSLGRPRTATEDVNIFLGLGRYLAGQTAFNPSSFEARLLRSWARVSQQQESKVNFGDIKLQDNPFVVRVCEDAIRNESFRRRVQERGYHHLWRKPRRNQGDLVVTGPNGEYTRITTAESYREGYKARTWRDLLDTLSNCWTSFVAQSGRHPFEAEKPARGQRQTASSDTASGDTHRNARKGNRQNKQKGQKKQCHGCGKFEHHSSSDCTVFRKSKQDASPKNKERGEGRSQDKTKRFLPREEWLATLKCHTCGVTGHKASHCPETKGKN